MFTSSTIIMVLAPVLIGMAVIVYFLVTRHIPVPLAHIKVVKLNLAGGVTLVISSFKILEEDSRDLDISKSISEGLFDKKLLPEVTATLMARQSNGLEGFLATEENVANLFYTEDSVTRLYWIQNQRRWDEYTYPLSFRENAPWSEGDRVFQQVM